MQNPTVSIIIPVYRAEEFIVQCLQSITAQTYQDFEVILVNDGSPDQTANIAQEFIDQNHLEHFHLIHKENGGVSSARNVGLQLAKGEWVAFIDSDDWVESHYLENMIHSITLHHSELCLCGYDAYEMEAVRFDPWSNYPATAGHLPDDLPRLTSFDYIWARMYRRDILEKHGIRFNEKIHYCEDNAFNFDYIRQIKTFSCVDTIGYHYRRGHTSALSKSLVQPNMRIAFVPHAQKFWDSFPEEILLNTIRNNRSFSRIMWNVTSTAVIMDILQKDYAAAKNHKHNPMTKAVLELYKPHSKKERAILFLWKHSFLGLKCLVRFYYGNFQQIKKHQRFFKFISH